MDGIWLHEETQKLIEAAPLNDEGLPVLNERFLDPYDFESYINPRLIMETNEQAYDWEYCASFPNIRCMVKRPRGILVSYLNEKGDEIERNLERFKARVFLHEMDHINGRTMTHWRLSEGNIDIVDGKKDKHPNLMTTVDFYK